MHDCQRRRAVPCRNVSESTDLLGFIPTLTWIAFESNLPV